MIVKQVTQVGNPTIRTRSKKVDKITPSVKKIITNLTDSMRHYYLVGMAAPQIGKSVRIFVTEIRKTKNRDSKILDSLRIFINPRITSVSKKQNTLREGCGSVAASGLFGVVKRPVAVTVRAQDSKGEKFELVAKGLLARVIQHEMDHLDGIVFTDRSDPKTFMSVNEHRKLQAKGK